jgi:acyl-CoA hydrolase
MEARHPAASRIELVELMEPADVNIRGFVHGGVIMRLADTAAGLAAVRHTGTAVVTASVDSLSFKEAVHVGDLVRLEANVTQAWRTSIEVEVQVWRETVRGGERTPTTDAFFTMVAVDGDGRPVAVRPVLQETEEDRERAAAADARRARRMADRAAGR